MRRRGVPRRGHPRRDRPLRLRLRRGGARDPGRPAAHRRAVRVRRADRRVDGAGAGALGRRPPRHRLPRRPGRARRWPRCGRSWREVRRDRPHLHRAPAPPTRASPRRSGRRSATRARSSTSAPAPATTSRPTASVTAVEPSAVMIAQRPPGAAPVVQARAEALPFEDGSFDAAMAVLTLHHWTRLARAGSRSCGASRGASSCSRWDPSFAARLWISADYFPELIDEDVARFPSLADQAGALRAHARRSRSRSPPTAATASTAPTGAVPEAYLDPVVRAGISVLAERSPGELDAGPRAARGRPAAPAPGPSATPTCSSSTSSTSATGCWSAAKALPRPPLERGAARPPPAPRAGGSSRPSSAAARRAPCAPSPTTRPGRAASVNDGCWATIRSKTARRCGSRALGL